MRRDFTAVAGAVLRRNLIHAFKNPALLIPSLIFPLLFFTAFAGGLSNVANIPGFPTSSYLDFAIAVPFMQGALFSSTTAGTELANDIESGFLNRLQLTPLRRIAILIGQMAGATTLAFLGALVYLAVGLIAGVDIKSGVGGAVLLVVYAVFIAIAFAGIGATMGARTGSPEAVQGVFPLIFSLFFLSSMSMPRDLIEIGWFRTVATINPVSYLVEDVRSVIIFGWDGEALALGFGFAAGLTVVALAAASYALTRRLART